MGKKTVNTCCPYCGSHEITADITVLVTGDLQPDRKIIVRDYWTPKTLTEESVAGCPAEDIRGFCSACGRYCAFDWAKGFIKE